MMLTASAVTGREASRPGPIDVTAKVFWGQDLLGSKYVGLCHLEVRRIEEKLSFLAGDLFHVARKKEV